MALSLRTFAGQARRRADEAGLTVAAERAGRVVARGTRAAGVAGGALVHVHAHGALGREAVLAEALALHALGVVGAVEVGLAEDVDVDLLARHRRVGLGLVALRAHAVVARRRVLAQRVAAAGPVQRHALVDV